MTTTKPLTTFGGGGSSPSGAAAATRPTPPSPPRSLKQYLSRSGVTQQDIADQVGVHQSYISQIVHGKRQPSIEVAVQLEALTEVPVKDLVRPIRKRRLKRRLQRVGRR